MTLVLGVSAFYHDSAAALLQDGRIVAAAQQERFSRIRHDAAFPAGAIDYCLKQANATPQDVAYVAFYEKPLLKFDRLLETWLAFAPWGFRSFVHAVPIWLKEKLHQQRSLKQAFANAKKSMRLVFPEHHESHAASAFFPSPFDEAAVLTLDGVGEWCTSSWGIGQGNRIQLRQQLSFPHSLGLLYSAFTYHCGFRVNSGEYKLMGLAPYGQPVYRELILRHLMDLRDDGSFRMDMRYFNYCQGLTMTNRAFSRLFNLAVRRPESRLTQQYCDLAASIQSVTEDVVLRMARHIHARTGMGKLVLAGGVALNCVANGRLLREGPFDDLWVQPAAGDAGGALGAACFVSHQLLDLPREPVVGDRQRGSLLGPRYSSAEVQDVLQRVGAVWTRYADESELLRKVAGLLVDGKVVGWFQGRLEFGPRALGSRSILGDARSPSMQQVMNQKIKFRESFRPFAPVVTREAAADWFALDRRHESPYMLLVASVLERHRVPLTQSEIAVLQESEDLCERAAVVRSTIPAVTHVDYSARLQTVDVDRNPRLHGLLREFERQTGYPLLVNTSFNVRGEPIVCSVADAWRCFQATDMDVLVAEDCVVLKSLNADVAVADRAGYLNRYGAD